MLSSTAVKNLLSRLVFEEKNNEVLLVISDSGIGMNPDTQKHIFDKFYRAHEGNTR